MGFLDWPTSRRKGKNPPKWSVNPSFLERDPRYRHGGDVKVLTQQINGRPVVTSVIHMGPDLHFTVPSGHYCRCGWGPAS